MVVTQCNTGCGSDNSKKPGMARVQPKPYYIPWGVTTALVLMFNLAAGIVFAVDMQYPIVSNTSLSEKFCQLTQLIAELHKERRLQQQ